MDGNCSDIEQSEENIPETPSQRRYPTWLIDTIVKSVCDSVETQDNEVHLQIIKTLVTIVSTFKCQAHDVTLLEALRACYKINLRKYKCYNL